MTTRVVLHMFALSLTFMARLLWCYSGCNLKVIIDDVIILTIINLCLLKLLLLLLPN